VGLKTHSYEKKQMKEEGFVTYYAEHYKLLHNQIAELGLLRLRLATA